LSPLVSSSQEKSEYSQDDEIRATSKIRYLIKFAGTSHQEKTKLHSHRDNGTNSQIVCIDVKHEHFDEFLSNFFSYNSGFLSVKTYKL
jgi:hypothetical protein